MIFPNELREKIEEISSKFKPSELKEVARKLSERYLENSGGQVSLANREIDIIAYANMRMPATYQSCYMALKEALSFSNDEIESVLDVGSGMGTASFAAFYCLNNVSAFTCVEKEQTMIELGKELMKDFPILKDTNWINEDYTKNLPDGKYDLVIISYSLNELSLEKREEVINSLLEHTNKLLVIVEPGTPKTSLIVKQARQQLIDKGMYVLTPCPHMNSCPIAEDDWCHFVTRVERSKLQRYLKEGSAPFEDEKFSYIAISKNKPIREISYRVMRHPLVNKGFISLTVCGKNSIEKMNVKKKDELYPFAKKAKCGDGI